MSLDDIIGHNFGGKPWMADVKPDAVVHFELDLNGAKLVKNEVPWGDKKETTEIIAEMRNIRYEENDEEIADDGEHTVPFWACEVVQEALKEIAKRTKRPKWAKLAYVRSVYKENNWEGVEKDFSRAAIAVL